MKILKFGGTSVGSAQSISTLVQLVKEQQQRGEPVALVCSALSGVTNTLLQLVTEAAAGKEFGTGLKTIEDRHFELVKELLEVKHQNIALLGLRLYFNELEEILAGIKALGEASPRTSDRLVAYGELCSNYTVAHVLRQHGVNAVFADARQLIKTDSNYGRVTVDEARTYELVRAYFSQLSGAIPVITGFIASDHQGNTTTLGRGGSDYTAALVGAAVGADEVQIWTDVDGFMTADPRLVKKAFPLKQLSYNEAIELSYFGAKVVHPPTMLPAIARKIPIVVKNTFNPSFAGTAIGAQSSVNGSLVKGITSIPAVSLLTVQGGGMVGYKGFSGRLFSALAQVGVNVILITQASSEHSITLAVSPKDAPVARKALEAEFRYELLAGKLSPPSVEEGYSVMAVVGENMKQAIGLSGKLFSALGRSGVNVSAIAQGSSELNISVVVSSEDISKALNSVHDALFLSPLKTLNVYCCGTGNIGATLLRQLEQHQEHLQASRHLKVNLVGVCNSRSMLWNRDGISLKDWQDELVEHGEQASLERFLEQAVSLNLPNSVFIDNTGSADVAGTYRQLFKQSFSVVTCNKIRNCGTFSDYYKDKQAVRKYGVDYLFETNVGAGLPIIKTLHDLLISGDQVLKIEAILSGTISYIFNEYKGDRTFAEVVREAQQKGFTEPDPRDDLSGLDFARKMLILARETGLPVELQDVQIEPILPESCIAAPTVEAFYQELEKSEPYFSRLKEEATATGKALRYIGSLEEGKVKVELVMAGPQHPFYSLSGSDNIISFTTDRYRLNPMVIKGPGAGAEVTAAGVLADLVRVAAH
ncbi:bifunctional aspartate kinase/homoserine dehydrogenase I [Pontibacter flavimaris]|uniref:Bifunctional aspartate kinase/homoserine dehydrogenase I n=1 Tax=Pontibacter flavimaris TaxID=1797110 RepID=A0A1Q5PCS5_9BACT|nr:bifunctional aspartate kinase/homoserine dehydrogenase I [Pontibacter flavimaris]OKL40045.1 bifunctional aspartate kinase/homoserine dehydrogenase I [Pontibacter flavimaris]